LWHLFVFPAECRLARSPEFHKYFPRVPSVSLVFWHAATAFHHGTQTKKVFVQKLSGRVIGSAPEDTRNTKNNRQQPTDPQLWTPTPSLL
jgi:hypothetical protein